MHARRQPFSHLARQRVGLLRRADSFDPLSILDSFFGSDEDGGTVKAATQTTTAKASTTDKTTAPVTQVKTSSTSSVQTAKTSTAVPLSSVLSTSSSTPAPASSTHLTTQSILPVAATTNRGTSPASLTTVSVAPSPTTSAGFDSSNSSNAKGAPAPKSGLSGGAVAGIVILVILVVLGFLVYLLRKLFLRRRERKRNTWGTGLPANFTNFNDVDNSNRDGGGGGFGEKYTDQQGPTSPSPEKQTLYPPSQFVANSGQGTRESYINANGNTFAISPPPGSSMSSPTLIAGFPAPPPMSYNNAYEPSRSSAHFHPTALTPGSPVLAGMDIPPALGNINAQAKDSAVVRSTFTPSLPDELSITSGEVVKVVHAFDDGWGLCLNSRGEQGMVPLECLDRSNGGNGNGTANSRLSAFSMQPQQGAMNQDNGNGEWKDARRMSSLYTSNTSGY